MRSVDERGTVYSKKRGRLVAGAVAACFLQAVLRGAPGRRLLSDERFSVDGTLIEARASMKRFRRKDCGDNDLPAGRNAEGDICGERRSNATHEAATDPDARSNGKARGQSSRLSRFEASFAGPDGSRYGRGRFRFGACQHLPAIDEAGCNAVGLCALERRHRSSRYISAFRRRLQRPWMRALRRRSQRDRFDWKRLERMTEIP